MTTILEEALEVVKDREQKYGPPTEHWKLTTSLINARFGTSFKPEDWAVCMILDKIARDAHSHQRDNDVDISGYANGHHRVISLSPGYVYKWSPGFGGGKTVEVKDGERP